MTKLPRRPDPERLARLEPPIATLGPETILFRIYRRAGPWPTTWRSFRRFGPVSRFDHQLPDGDGTPRAQDRGVLYAALDVASALAETFQHERRRINRTRHAPWLAAFRIRRTVPLLDLGDTFAVRVGASMKLVSGAHSVSQAWSRGFADAYPEIAGMRYPSSLTNRPAIVLFERADAEDVLPSAPLLNRSLDDPGLHVPLKVLAEEIGYRLL